MRAGWVDLFCVWSGGGPILPCSFDSQGKRRIQVIKLENKGIFLRKTHPVVQKIEHI